MTETFISAELVGQVVDKPAYITGVANIDRRMVLVLDVGALLTLGEQTSTVGRK